MSEKEQKIRIGFLNVVATPHPEGVYERIFRQVLNKPVKYWGANTAAITSLRARADESDLFSGQILTWIEIDPSSPAVDKQKLEEVALSDDAKKMTTTLGFNSRAFKFVLDTKQHRVTLECINEFNHNLSPIRALSIFERLFSPESLGADTESIDVTIIPEDDALAYVLGINRLDKIEILVKRPNEDDVTEETHDVLEELKRQNAKRQQLILTRAGQTDGLELNDNNEKYARVAANGNGYVSSKGRDADGDVEIRSTKERPKVIERIVAAGGTALSTLVQAAKEARARRPRG